MALAKKAGAGSKTKGASRAASMNTDDMFAGGGGLPNLFQGTVASARLVKWVPKEGSNYGPRLAAQLLIAPADDQPEDAVLPQKHLDENDGHVKALYGVGKLSEWLPSMDGEEAVDVDADEDGIYAVPTEELIEKFERAGHEGTPQLNRGTNWAYFLQKMFDAGFDKKQMQANIDCLEGLEAVWSRVPPPERSGMPQSATGEDGGQRRDSNMILVPSELITLPYKGAAKKAGAAKAATKAAPPAKAASKKAAAKADENGAGELDEKLAAAIVEALNDADDNTLTVQKAKKAAVAALDASEKKDGLARLGEEEFWADAEGFALDDEEGVVSLVE